MCCLDLYSFLPHPEVKHHRAFKKKKKLAWVKSLHFPDSLETNLALGRLKFQPCFLLLLPLMIKKTFPFLVGAFYNYETRFPLSLYVHSWHKNYIYFDFFTLIRRVNFHAVSLAASHWFKVALLCSVCEPHCKTKTFVGWGGWIM